MVCLSFPPQVTRPVFLVDDALTKIQIGSPFTPNPISSLQLRD